MKRLLLLVQALVCIIVFCSAGPQRLFLEQLSVEEGLAHTDVNAVVQDSTGYMWIGTYSGLCRYDGTRFVHYNITNSILKSSRICSLLISSENKLYIGTETGGITIYDTSSERFIKTVPIRSSVNSIFEDGDRIWLCTDDGMSLLKLDGESHELTSWSLGFRVNGGCPSDVAGRPYLATNRGILAFEAEKSVEVTSLEGCTSIKPLPSGSYFVTSTEGCFILDPSGKSAVRLNGVASLTSTVDSESNVWVGTGGEGIIRFSSDFSTVERFLPGRGEDSFREKFNITSLFFDSSSVLWIGTIGNGCYKSNELSRQFLCYSLDRDATRHPVTNMYADSRNRLWVSFRDGTLAVFDNGTLTTVDSRSISVFEMNPVSAICEMSDGSIWLGSWSKGIAIIPGNQTDAAACGKSFRLLRPSQEMEGLSVFKFAQNEQGDIWMSTNRGVCRIPAESGNAWQWFRHDNGDESTVTDDYSTDILIDRRGDSTVVWAGSRYGLTRFICDSSDGSVLEVKRLLPSEEEGGMFGEFVAVIHKSAAGDIWISTLGGGLNRLVSEPFADSPKFELYNNVRYPFPNNELESVLEDGGGNFWIGGNGLTRFNPETGEVRCYTRNDGLQSNVFKIWDAAKFPDGRMAFGGIVGFNVFDPAAIRVNSVAPSVAVVDMQVNGEMLQLGKPLRMVKELELKHNQNNIQLDFAAFHYENARNNVYRYRLLGAEQEWHTTDGSSAKASYLNLRPGKYSFSVYAGNADGVWSRTPAKLSFRIRRPFYASLVAFFFYILIAVALVLSLILSARARSNHRHQLELEKKLLAEQQQRNENELRFQTEFLHEVKTPLTLIKTPVEELLSNANLGKNTQSRLKLVLQSANILQKDIEAVTDLRRFDNGYVQLHVVNVDLCRFVEEIAILFQPVAKSRGIEYVMDLPEEGVEVFIDKDKMEKVLLNLLSNAIKYSPDQVGRISVSVCREGDAAKIRVANLGMGILPKDMGRIFDRFVQGSNNKLGGLGIGLAISKYIVESHSGEISAVSTPGEETVFTVSLPLGESHFSPDDIDRDYSNSDHISNYDSLAEFTPAEGIPGGVVDREYTVLVVDDNPVLISYLEQLLSTRYNILKAGSGQQGYEMAIADQPDLVLTDVVMPGMNGLELCSKIKNNNDTAHIPVILITARDLPVHKIEGFQMMADDYITKPFHADILLSRIENLIRQRENMRNSFRSNVSLEPSAVTATPVDEKFMRKCITSIEKNISNPDFGVEDLCAEVGCSRPQLYRRIKSITGQSAIHFIRSVRLKRAAQMLSADSGISVSEVMSSVGFGNHSYFSKIFQEEFGVMPKDYRG